MLVKEVISPDQAAMLTQRALDDPVWWIREVLGREPWEKQIEIIESVRDHRTTAVKSCHASGKSFDAGAIALWFLYAHQPSIVLTTAPTDRQVRGILWKEIRKNFQRAKLPLGGTILTQELKLAEDWFAWGFTAPDYDPDRFQGFHEIYLLVIADESSGVSDEIFEGIDGVLTSEQCRLLMIGNPTNPTGRFARAFKSPDVNKISISAFETPNFTTFGITDEDMVMNRWESKITGELPAPYLITPRWVHERLHDWTHDSPLYAAKVLAQFPEAGTDTLIPLHWVEAAVDRTLKRTSPAELGVDVARYGSDQTVIILRQGPVARITKTMPMSSTMAVAGEVIKALRETGASSAKVDAVGIGAGTVDRLVEQRAPVEEMQSGATSSDPEVYLNTRAEWYWGLRIRFETGDIDIENDAELISQLSNIKYMINSRGQIQIESKEDMKKRGLPSPDKADTLMLAFAKKPLKGKRVYHIADDYAV
ncbi:MAG: hypothetical protein ABFC78_09330 [Methanoregula sp.]